MSVHVCVCVRCWFPFSLALFVVFSSTSFSAWIYPIMPTNRVNKININVGEWTMATTATEQKFKRSRELEWERRRRRSTIHRKSHWINNNGNNMHMRCMETRVFVEFQFSDLNDWSISTVICFLLRLPHHPSLPALRRFDKFLFSELD